MLEHIPRPLSFPLNMPHATVQGHPLHIPLIYPPMQNITIIKHYVSRPQRNPHLPWHIPPFLRGAALLGRPRADMRPRHNNKRPIPVTQREVPLRVERRPLQRSELFLPGHGRRDIVAVPGKREGRDFLA